MKYMKRNKFILLSLLSSISVITSCYKEPVKQECPTTNEKECPTCEQKSCDTEKKEETSSDDVDEKRFVYKHVVAIGVDGAGVWWNATNTPNFDRIFGDYAITNDCIVNNPTISAQSWGAMFYGISSTIHGRTNSTTAVWNNATYPSIFKQLENAKPNSVKYALANWNGISPMIESDSNTIKFTNSSSESDLQVVNNTIRVIKTFKPALTFAQLDIVDHTGHSSSYNSNAYLEAIKVADEQLGRIFDSVVSAGMEENTLFVLISDHGGIGQSHGNSNGYVSENESHVTCALRGKSINNVRDFHMLNRDFPAIVGHALETNSNMDSYLPKGVFKDKKNPFRDEFIINPIKKEYRVLSNYIDTSKLKLGLLFDNCSIQDVNGQDAISNDRTVIRYSSGYKGFGYYNKASTIISCNENLSLGGDSFTYASWLNPSAAIGNDDTNVFFSNKNWDSGGNPGVNFYVNTKDNALALSYNITVGSTRTDLNVFPDPTFSRDKWIHYMVVYNKEDAVITVYINFKKIISRAIPSAHLAEGATLDTSNRYVIGSDGAKQTSKFFYNGIIDDVLIFDSAIDQDTINNLRSYYSD